MKRETSGPLSGVRVLDITTVQMGPLAAAILADLGADVVKIEPPAGDISRQSHPFRNRGMGHEFLPINRNKRSVCLDLKTKDGRDALLALAKSAHVMLYNVRPKAMERLALGWEDVRKVNPTIVYVGAMGFSQRGRYAAKPAYDVVVQGMAGIPWMMAKASGQAPRYAPYSYADQSSGLHVAIAVLAALLHARATGEGQRVDVPMFENLVHTLLGEHMAGARFVPGLGPVGNPRQLSELRRPYATRDGYVCPFIYSDKQWRTFFELIGDPRRMETDERFASHASRTKNFDAVFGLVQTAMTTRTTAEWIALFDAHDLPIGPMNSLDDVLNDPHLHEVGFYEEVAHPTEGFLRTTRYPTEFSATPVSNRRHAPALGESTAELLREAGFSDRQIAAMLEAGAAVADKPIYRGAHAWHTFPH